MEPPAVRRSLPCRCLPSPVQACARERSATHDGPLIDHRPVSRLLARRPRAPRAGLSGALGRQHQGTTTPLHASPGADPADLRVRRRGTTRYRGWRTPLEEGGGRSREAWFFRAGCVCSPRAGRPRRSSHQPHGRGMSVVVEQRRCSARKTSSSAAVAAGPGGPPLLGVPPCCSFSQAEPTGGSDPQGIRWLRDFLQAQTPTAARCSSRAQVLAEIAQTVDEVVGAASLSPGVIDEFQARRRAPVWVRSPEPERLRAALAAREDFPSRRGGEAGEGSRCGAPRLRTWATPRPRSSLPVYELYRPRRPASMFLEAHGEHGRAGR